MKHLQLSILATLTLLSVATSEASAQSARGQFLVGPVLALYDPMGYGGQMEARVSDAFSIGADGRYWFYSKTYDPGIYDWSGYTVQAVLKYHVFRDYHVDPYVSALIGWSRTRDSFDYQRLPAGFTSTAYAGVSFSLAVGIRYFFTDALAVNVDVEKFLTDDANFGNRLGLNLGVEFAIR